MNPLRKKTEAINLRKQGYSYSEIHDKIGIPKSTLSGWFKYIPFTVKEKKIIEKKLAQKQIVGYEHSALVNKKRRIEREEKAEEKAKKLFNKYKNRSDFLIGVSLYWAEGSKKSHCFQFINSDSDMIRFMQKWILNYIEPKKENLKYRLFIHKPYSDESLENFWSDIVSEPTKKFQKTIVKPTNYNQKKNLEYKGCLRIEISTIESLRIVRTWQNELIRYYNA